MKILTMSRFQDLFVAQVLGMLLSRKYSGMVNFLFEDEKIPTSVWLNSHGITHVQRQAATDFELLNEIIWQTQGRVGLYPKIAPPNGSILNFPEFIEMAIIKLLPPMPLSCSMLKHSYLQREMQRSEQSSTFAVMTRGLLNKIPPKGIELSHMQATSDSVAFWPMLLYLCSNGQISCSYEQTMGRVLEQFEGHLLKRLANLFGTRATIPFIDKVRETLQYTWSDWTPNTLPDQLYGTAPYYLWAKTLKANVSIVGAPTLADRCFEQALEKLTAEDASLVRYLCNWLFN